MIDHLIFNKLKWFNVNQNAEQISANGKRYVAFPPKVVVKQDYGVNTMTGSLGKIMWTSSPLAAHSYKKGTEATCIGVYEGCYVVKDLMDFGGGDSTDSSADSTIAIIEKDLFLAKWGGKRLLSHLYQALRRVVIA